MDSSQMSRSRFPLASAFQRFFSKIIDLIFILLIIFGISISILLTDPEFSTSNGFLYISQTWRYFLITIISFLLSFLYLIVLPYFWKGQTLFKKLFKLRFYNLLPLSNFFINLIKHDFFIWIIFSLISLILGIALWSLGPDLASELIRSLNIFNDINVSTTCTTLIIIFNTFYIIAGAILIFVIIQMFLRNKKSCAIDNFSNVVVIKLINYASDTPDLKGNIIKSKKINFTLPGEVLGSAVEEVQEF